MKLPFLFLLYQSIQLITSQSCPALDERCQCVGDVIDCANAGLESIPQLEPSSFTWESILLNNNQILEVPNGAFANINVSNINLGVNYIDTLGDEAFGDVADYVEAINLRENRLIPDAVLAIHDLPLLRTLNLDYNLITELTSDHFVGLPSLTSLLMEYNEIVALQRAYTENVPTLRTLDVSGNAVRYVAPDALNHLADLIELDFGFGSLERIPTESLDGLTSLEDLNFWANDIAEIEADDLATVSSSLRALTIGNNEVDELSDGLFRTIPNLSNLNMDLMNLQSLPDDIFENMTQLYDLRITDNSLSEIPVAIRNLPALQSFAVDRNAIERINGDEFMMNQEVLNIGLSDNQISEVNQTLFCNNQGLVILSLQRNQITDFDACAALTTPFLNIGLEGNPVDCGCDILWLREGDKLSNSGGTYCASPPELAGRAVIDVGVEEFQCDLDQEEECANICQ